MLLFLYYIITDYWALSRHLCELLHLFVCWNICSMRIAIFMIHCNAMLVIYFQISITTLSFMIHCHIFPLHYDVGLETSSAMFIWLLCLSVCVVWVVLHCLQCIGEVVAIKSGSSCWWEIKKKKLAAAHLWCIAMHCDVKSSCQSFWQNQILVRRGAERGEGWLLNWSTASEPESQATPVLPRCWIRFVKRYRV